MEVYELYPTFREKVNEDPTEAARWVDSLTIEAATMLAYSITLEANAMLEEIRVRATFKKGSNERIRSSERILEVKEDLRKIQQLLSSLGNDVHPGIFTGTIRMLERASFR